MDRAATSEQGLGEPSTMAKPLKLQKLEQYLNLNPYLNFLEHEFASDDDSSLDATEENITKKFGPNEMYSTSEEVRLDRSHFYNLSGVGSERKWLEDILLSDTEDDDSDASDGIGEQEKILLDNRRIKEMLKEHVNKKKYQLKFAKNPELRQYQFYGSGLLSTIDRFPAHQESVLNEIRQLELAAPSPDSRKRKKPGEGAASKKIKKEMDLCEANDDVDSWMDREESGGLSPLGGLKIVSSSSSKSKRKNSTANSIEAMNARRRKLWVHIAKKEVGKTQRARSSNHKEVLTSCKRTAQLCMRVNRHKAIQSQKNMKDCIWRMKRMTREMQSFWKRFDRVERETRRRMEKDAEEQRKYDAEFREVKRQQRKLNFLITQTELYAHFMQGKLTACSSQPDELARILGHLDEADLPSKFADEYDSEAMKTKAQENVTQALTLDQAHVQEFPLVDPQSEIEQKQPEMFEGVLKHYQIKGVSWLANLYDQGINGILADEMGLGKTVQSIAFLCHIAEKYSIWGPFLVISPASTLHNWQQEFAKFVPPFKVIPYWGTPQERRILRQFWAQKNVHTEEASFHVVITSYQLVVADIKYFNRVKWQYLVLDEAQAIKSSSSVRWKSLLGFQCRNRLLLSGTPVQNSMAELWALLHFIMPTLFDNHEEFAEWFSKDIESHAENKGSIDEKHLSRLHMILKPFMLRRIKKDVENELSDKIELMVYCPLTTRQKLLYSALKKKIRIEDLLHSSSSGTQSSVTSSLMNLVMQFRKVCNHPELFERQDPRVAYHCRPVNEDLPFLVFNESIVPEFNPESHRSALKMFCIFSPQNVHLSCVGNESYRTFSFARLLNLSPCDIASIYLQGAQKLWSLLGCDSSEIGSKQFNMKIPKLNFEPQDGLPNLIFTKSANCRTYGFGTVNIHSMPETLEHRILRSSKLTPIKTEVGVEVPHASSSQANIGKNPNPPQPPVKTQTLRRILPEFKHEPRAMQVLDCQPLDIPRFLTHVAVKVDSRSRKLYCYSRRAANTFTSMQDQVTEVLSKRITPLREHVPWGSSPQTGGLEGTTPPHGWSSVLIPDKQSLISDAGKLSILDGMLHRLKGQGHRVLVYSQMTKMIDLLEEFMYYRKHTYMRLDGSSKISERRDMVADFQNREDIFVFLLSTRAGGLGINLTAADTVIFYDSDWNPTVDQQAMDRAHRLGQTKQVTVYRLICKDTIEERILQRAQEKSEIQRMVISGGSFKPDTLKPTEVVSLLLDDAEIEHKYRQKQAERRGQEEKKPQAKPDTPKLEDDGSNLMPTSPSVDEDSDGTLIVDVEGLQPASHPSAQTQTSGSRPFVPTSSRILSAVRGLSSQQRGAHGRTRGRPRGSRGRGRASSRSSHGSPNIDGTMSVSEGSEISSPGIRRGPGRPRLKPHGPSHQGGRKGKKSSESNPGSPCSSPLVIGGSSSSREVKEREFKSFDLFLQ